MRNFGDWRSRRRPPPEVVAAVALPAATMAANWSELRMARGEEETNGEERKERKEKKEKERKLG